MLAKTAIPEKHSKYGSFQRKSGGRVDHAKLGIRHLKMTYGERAPNGKMLKMLPWIGFIGRNLLPYVHCTKGTDDDDGEALDKLPKEYRQWLKLIQLMVIKLRKAGRN